MGHDDVWFELISASVDGEVDRAERQALDEHLQGSASARHVHQQLTAIRRETLVRSVDDVPDLSAQILAQRPPQGGARRGRRGRWIAAGATGAVAAAASIVALVAVVGGGGSAEPERRAAPGSSVDIGISESAFDETDVHVAAGSTVHWTNHSSTVHHLVHELPDASVDGVLRPAEERAATIDEPGSYRFWCAIHENMRGTITVDG